MSIDGVDVSDWPELGEETIGTKPKVWLQDPDGVAWLFKQVRSDAAGGDHYGDDWAEVLGTRIGAALGVPVADTALASRHGQRGSISRRVNDRETEDLIGGNELLFGQDKLDNPRSRRADPDYTLETVRHAMESVAPPPLTTELVEPSAYGVWAGYLMLDAIIANQDRHAGNWAVIRSTRSSYGRLAPSFDHGSSLGFNLTEQRVSDLLARGRSAAWAARGRNEWLDGRPDLVAVAREAMVADPAAEQHWMDQLTGLTDPAVGALIAALPEGHLSEHRRTFLHEIITTNQRRLLDGDPRR